MVVSLFPITCQTYGYNISITVKRFLLQFRPCPGCRSWAWPPAGAEITWKHPVSATAKASGINVGLVWINIEHIPKPSKTCKHTQHFTTLLSIFGFWEGFTGQKPVTDILFLPSASPSCKDSGQCLQSNPWESASLCANELLHSLQDHGCNVNSNEATEFALGVAVATRPSIDFPLVVLVDRVGECWWPSAKQLQVALRTLRMSMVSASCPDLDPLLRWHKDYCSSCCRRTVRTRPRQSVVFVELGPAEEKACWDATWCNKNFTNSI